jgi:hypothetical protein
LLRESPALILADVEGAGEEDSGADCSGNDAGTEDDVEDSGGAGSAEEAMAAMGGSGKRPVNSPQIHNILALVHVTRRVAGAFNQPALSHVRQGLPFQQAAR